VNSGVETGGSGGSMNWGPELLGARVVGPQKNFRQENNRRTSEKLTTNHKVRKVVIFDICCKGLFGICSIHKIDASYLLTYCTKFGQLILTKISKFIGTRC